MPDSIVIDVSDEALLEALERLPNTVSGNIARANLDTGRMVIRGAQARVSVRYGFLKQSIDMKASTRTGDVFVGIARGAKFPIPNTKHLNGKFDIATPSKYAHLVERGTERAAAKPFLWPAVEASQMAHRERLMQAITDALEAEGMGDA
jgi:HK97 gp10 family phage protein